MGAFSFEALLYSLEDDKEYRNYKQQRNGADEHAAQLFLRPTSGCRWHQYLSQQPEASQVKNHRERRHQDWSQTHSGAQRQSAAPWRRRSEAYSVNRMAVFESSPINMMSPVCI